MKKHVFNLLYWKSMVFGMLTIISKIFWKSVLYVYAEGQLYWNLDSILSVRIYIYGIWTFVIVTILPTHFKISIYIENRHCLHFPNVSILKDFVLRSYFDSEIGVLRLILFWFILKGLVPGSVRNISRDLPHWVSGLSLEKSLISGVGVCELKSSSLDRHFRTNGSL